MDTISLGSVSREDDSSGACSLCAAAIRMAEDSSMIELCCTDEAASDTVYLRRCEYSCSASVVSMSYIMSSEYMRYDSVSACVSDERDCDGAATVALSVMTGAATGGLEDTLSHAVSVCCAAS